jgi:flagellar hook assembly protein FlgD
VLFRSATPTLAFSASFSNSATWFPSLRVKNARGFYGVASKRYDALSMSLDFSNQSFRAGLGQTSVVSYASSTGGFFSTFIYDSNSNVVRTLESNVYHAAGSAQLAWDGKSDGGFLVATGVYYAVVRQILASNVTVTYDPSVLQMGSDMSYDVGGIFGISTPETFNPYSGSPFPIQYTSPAPARVTVLIQNDALLTIAVVCSNALRSAGAHTEYWDGRMTNGLIMPVGARFHVAIQVLGIGANALIVESALTPILNPSVSAPKFMPALNPYGTSTNSLILSYQLEGAADVRITVRRSDGSVIQDALDPGKVVGANQTIWSGTTSGGSLAAPGLYTVTLSSESGGVRGDPSTVWVEVYY